MPAQTADEQIAALTAQAAAYKAELDIANPALDAANAALATTRTILIRQATALGTIGQAIILEFGALAADASKEARTTDDLRATITRQGSVLLAIGVVIGNEVKAASIQ